MRNKKENQKSSFFYAFAFLPKEKREAINVFYSFSRISDSIADAEGKELGEKKSEFLIWKNDFYSSLEGKSQNSLLVTLAEVIERYNIPVRYFTELLEGIESDLDFENVKTVEDLERYAYSVASTVGLILIHILGFTNEAAENYAVSLGKALQITNIMRDVKTDFDNGRIYVPESILTEYGYSAEELKRGEFNRAFKQVMLKLDELARDYYEKAANYFPSEDYGTLYPAQAMGGIYFELLRKIEKNGFNIFEGKIKVPKFVQLRIVAYETIKGTLFK